jgi:hypothetical protein
MVIAAQNETRAGLNGLLGHAGLADLRPAFTFGEASMAPGVSRH